MTAEDVSRQIAGKGLTPPEEAAYRKFSGVSHDASILPKDTNDLLTRVYLKLTPHCPKDVTGVTPWNVQRPTIVEDVATRETDELKIPRVCIQWGGRTRHRLIDSDFQFRFELFGIGTESPVWLVSPHRYQVLFVGRVSEWPILETKPLAIRTCKGKDGVVVWVGCLNPNSFKASGFATQIVCLGNPNVGAIEPRCYENIQALDFNDLIPSSRHNGVIICGNCGCGVWKMWDATTIDHDALECARCRTSTDRETEQMIREGKGSSAYERINFFRQGDLLSQRHFCAMCFAEDKSQFFVRYQSRPPADWVNLRSVNVCPDCAQAAEFSKRLNAWSRDHTKPF